MSTTYKPQGYSNVTPYFIVTGADRFIEFLRDCFDAEEIEKNIRLDGSIQHAACRIGDSIVEIGECSGRDFPSRQNTIHLFVKDVDEVYNRTLQAGARSIYEPQDHDYGERSGGVEDPFGNHWYIAMNISR